MASYSVYPPILDSYTPAFLADEGCKLNFSVSKYNSDIEQINNFKVQATVREQKTNINAAKDDKKAGTTGSIDTSSGIILNIPIEVDKDMFYVNLSNSFVNWVPGKVYLIQLRIDAAGGYKESGGDANTYLVNNASSFSEWSTICVAKAITKPSIVYYGNKPEIFYDLYTKFKYSNNSNEQLYSYFLTISGGGKTIQTKEIIVNNYSNYNGDIIYDAETMPIPGQTYDIVVHYTTINGYKGKSNVFNQLISVEGEESCPIKVELYETNNAIFNLGKEVDDGVIAYKFVNSGGTTQPLAAGRYLLRRAQDDNPDRWEILKEFTITDNNRNTVSSIHADWTASGDDFYRYSVQSIDDNGIRGKAYITDAPVFREYEYSYLIGGHGRKLAISLDTQINSFRINTNGAITKTINQQYPFFNKVGNNNFKSFSLNGLVSFNMDDSFCTNLELYGAGVKQYMAKFGDDKYSHVHEKKFRDKVFDFLNDGQPKLYKSIQEGNILVVLTEVSFTPTTNLGRLTYAFSATATEIDECTIDNLHKYSIWNKKNYDIYDNYNVANDEDEYYYSHNTSHKWSNK